VVRLTFDNNVPSLTIQRSLRKNQTGLERALQRLASGYRINSAADDAAGAALSAQFDARQRSYVVAERNTATAIAMASTADGGAGEITDTITRMREIAVQAADGALTSTNRAALDVEFQALRSEVDRLAEATTFNGTSLLSGSVSTLSFQVGIDGTSHDQISVSFGGVSASNLGIGAVSVTGTGATNATTAISALDSALATLGTTRGKFGGAVNRLGFALSNNQSMRSNLAASLSAIRDADVAEEASNVARHQVLLQAGASALATANDLGAMLVKTLLGT
jgi:flagellin